MSDLKPPDSEMPVNNRDKPGSFDQDTALPYNREPIRHHPSGTAE